MERNSGTPWSLTSARQEKRPVWKAGSDLCKSMKRPLQTQALPLAKPKSSMNLALQTPTTQFQVIPFFTQNHMRLQRLFSRITLTSRFFRVSQLKLWKFCPCHRCKGCNCGIPLLSVQKHNTGPTVLLAPCFNLKSDLTARHAGSLWHFLRSAPILVC